MIENRNILYALEERATKTRKAALGPGAWGETRL